MGGAASRFAAPMKQRRVERDLDNKVVAALRERARTRKKTFKSVNSITMRLPRFKDGLRDIRDVFDHYGKNAFSMGQAKFSMDQTREFELKCVIFFH
jgi:calcium-binding protein CML